MAYCLELAVPGLVVMPSSRQIHLKSFGFVHVRVLELRMPGSSSWKTADLVIFARHLGDVFIYYLLPSSAFPSSLRHPVCVNPMDYNAHPY